MSPSATPASAKKPVVSDSIKLRSRVEPPQPVSLVEIIRARAYQLYEMRGREGHAEEDWLQAEIDVLSVRPKGAA